MGCKGSKKAKPAKLSSKDLKFLMKQTEQPKEKIVALFEEFHKKNADGVLDKKEFVNFYCELRSEPKEKVEEIAKCIFEGFDRDDNGYISFSEFMIGYAMTSRGDPRDKLDYAFDVYDTNNSGYLDKNELSKVIYAMLNLLGAEKKDDPDGINELATDCLKKLDKNEDGRVSKEEFIVGLSENYSLKALMNPFN